MYISTQILCKFHCKVVRCFQCTRHFASSVYSHNQKTALYDFHLSQEGKMVTFAGFDMPVEYGNIGIAQSHKHVRKSCGLFDVSHMLQTKVYGKDGINFIESLTVADIANLAVDSGTLTLFTNENGGIIDDLICSRTKEYLYIVSNAGCREKDLAHMRKKLSEYKSNKMDVELEILENFSLLALQGPDSSLVLQPLIKEDLNKFYFMNTMETAVSSIPCRLTRCGYTGEDGFEICVHNDKVVQLCETLLTSKNGNVQLAGLGARDSLRLEAGLCLYGKDINENITPIEAVLAWTVAKQRRKDANFPGSEVILKQLQGKPNKCRIGLISKGAPPRAGCSIIDASGQLVGEVTSGCPSPSLGVNVAMGYIPASLSKVGTVVDIIVRQKPVKATVSKMPFIRCNYFMPNK